MRCCHSPFDYSEHFILMKTILQHLDSGTTEIVDVPAPTLQPGSPKVLIQNAHSLVSIGTERMLLEFGRGNLLAKARQQPDKVKEVIDKAASDGIVETIGAVRSKLGKPIPLGYCAAGTVIDPGNSDFAAGDRVVSNGHHAELVAVSRNLVASIPDSVSTEAACFAPAAAIALQGIRLAKPELGETIVVMGLGLIGQLAVQIALANGCKVIGTDYDPRKVELATRQGATGIQLEDGGNPISMITAIAGPEAVDAVIITASTKSNDPVHQAASVCRKRGRIVLVGVTGLDLRRDDFYKKELSFQVSCSYGPGRYDTFHEDQGNDYPIGFVRWTMKRNFEAVLSLMANGRLDIASLITSRHQFDEAVTAYDQIAKETGAMGVILEYPENTQVERTVPIATSSAQSTPPTAIGKADSVSVSCIGAGNYASRVLLPSFKQAGVSFDTLVSETGVSSTVVGRSLDFATATTEIDAALDGDSDIIVIATRHDSHANLAIKALQTGKKVFVEKPMALSRDELLSVEQAARANPAAAIMVGFNRRYAPLVQTMHGLLSSITEPKCFNITINAGAIPTDSWVQSRQLGGGRIIGEACHWIDLMRYLANAAIVDVQGWGMGQNPAHDIVEDKAIINLRFADGSIGCLNYFANGGKRLQKERIEVFAADAVLQLNNFKQLKGYGWPGFTSKRAFSQDKGQNACVKAFVESIEKQSVSPISLEELIEVHEATFTADEQIRS
jgi:predicted dehydrogenase/threonine dehydrogenase-like Zn-dependent dehydrogenase